MASFFLSSSRQNDPEKESRLKITEVVDAYDAVIQANIATEQKYRAEETILLQRLNEIQTELREHRDMCHARAEPEKPTFRYYTVGKPYFKDKNYNSPPDNEDTIIMKQYQMYDFSNVMTVSGWTIGDRNRIMSVLLDLTKDIIKQKLYAEISQLHRAKTKTVACISKISKLKQDILDLKHKTLDELKIPKHTEFDWEEIALKLNKRHAPHEYKAIWELFFHPRVNKKAWGPEEHQELQRIAGSKGMQDWESIAKELNMNRTGYQCFVYFRTNVNHAASGRKWTQKEMNYLQRVINLYKEENYIAWGKVAASMQNRTKIQCYNKYLRMIEGRKGRFLPEEDAVILNFVNVYGTDFRKMATFLTGRSPIQLRVRYNLLLKLRVSATWQVEDDRKLLQIMANQDSRTNFSEATAHFPGKDRQNIRSRYNTLIRWMKLHPYSDISTAPRRGARRLLHGAPGPSLVRALRDLRDRVRAEGDADDKGPKAKQKYGRASSETAIHDSILSTLATLDSKYSQPLHRTLKAKVEDSYQMLTLQDISSTPAEHLNRFNMKYFLLMLNAKLNKTKFCNSTFGQGFEGLEERPRELLQVKSYSKVELHNPIEPHLKPDLFGNIAGRRRFLFPPNFATITGSRVILTYLSNTYSKDKVELNVKNLARRDVSLRSALTTLNERFCDLFTWPYILSNEPPEYFKVCSDMLKEKRANAKPVSQKSLPSVPAVTIPPKPPKRLRVKKGDKRIDVENTLADIDIDIAPDFDRELQSDVFERDDLEMDFD